MLYTDTVDNIIMCNVRLINQCVVGCSAFPWKEMWHSHTLQKGSTDHRTNDIYSRHKFATQSVKRRARAVYSAWYRYVIILCHLARAMSIIHSVIHHQPCILAALSSLRLMMNLPHFLKEILFHASHQCLLASMIAVATANGLTCCARIDQLPPVPVGLRPLELVPRLLCDLGNTITERQRSSEAFTCLSLCHLAA